MNSKAEHRKYVVQELVGGLLMWAVVIVLCYILSGMLLEKAHISASRQVRIVFSTIAGLVLTIIGWYLNHQDEIMARRAIESEDDIKIVIRKVLDKQSPSYDKRWWTKNPHDFRN